MPIPATFSNRVVPLVLICVFLWGLTFVPEQAMGEESPAFGDRMLIGTIGEASNLIPFLSTILPPAKYPRCSTWPLRYNKDLEIEPWAAASYEVEGGKLLRFLLRDDLQWEDGQAVTAWNLPTRP